MIGQNEYYLLGTCLVSSQRLGSNSGGAQTCLGCPLEKDINDQGGQENLIWFVLCEDNEARSEAPGRNSTCTQSNSQQAEVDVCERF